MTSRAPYRFNRRVDDREYVNRIRRHTPSSLVPLVAQVGAHFADRAQWLAPRAPRPWALADIARVALELGTEFNRSPATVADVLECAAAYDAITDPDLHRQTPGSLRDFMLRIAGEQLPYQQEVFHDLARSAAVFLRPPDPDRPPRVMVGDWEQEVFGCTLGQYLNAAFLLHVGARKNSGMFDPAWIDQSQFADIREHLSSELMHTLFARHFVADRGKLGATQRDVEDKVGRPEPAYRRSGFNPLQKYPVVSGLGETWYMPVPHLLLRCSWG